MIKLKKKIILASKSPRRKELLENIGIMPIIIPSKVDETLESYKDFKDYVEQLAKKKAYSVIQNQELEDYILVASDTVVVYNNNILEKPLDEIEAFNMLSFLSGNVHQVYTSLFIYEQGTGREIVESVITEVSFRKLSKKIIEDYIRTKEPMDKAGAYGIQGYGSQFVTNINGCYFSVMGFPISLFVEKLNQWGYLI